jgi:hypothetical protein
MIRIKILIFVFINYLIIEKSDKDFTNKNFTHLIKCIEKSNIKYIKIDKFEYTKIIKINKNHFCDVVVKCLN